MEVAQSIAIALEFPDELMYAVASTCYGIFEVPVLFVQHVVMQVFPYQLEAMNTLTDQHKFVTRKPLPLGRPIDIFSCVVLYFSTLAALFVVGRIAGKRKYKTFGLFHNTFLFLLSIYMAISFFFTAIVTVEYLWNNPTRNETDNDWRLAKLMWVFTISKLPEYIDTFLMVLKHNYHQITFLHLYHHTSIFLFCAMGCILAPGGDAYWSAMLNSFVHIFMYGYYAGTMIFSEGPVRRFLNSIKFVITKGQLTQFICNMAQALFIMSKGKDARYNLDVVHFQAFYMLSMLGLFGNFLLKGQARAAAAARRVGSDIGCFPAPTDSNDNRSPTPKSSAADSRKRR